MVGHHLVYAVVTVALLEGPVENLLIEHPMSLLRNTFRVMEHVDISGTRHLFIAYLVVRDDLGKSGVAVGFLDVDVDEEGAVSVKDPGRDRIIGAPNLEDLVTGLQDVSGLGFDPGPDARHADHPDTQRRIIPEPASNLWVTEEEQLSWMPPHDRLPYDRTLDFINPVLILQSPHHPEVELYANSFVVTGESLVYVDESRATGVLRFGCPITHQNGSAILHCPTADDSIFASRFDLQEGYAYDLEALARQLEAGGMMRVPAPDSGTDAESLSETTTMAVDPDTTPVNDALCPACFTFYDGLLHYVDPHGRQGALRFDREPGDRGRYVLGDIEHAEDRTFALLNGFERLRRYTEDDIVLWLLGEGYERVGIE